MTWVTDTIFVAGGDFVFENWTDFQWQAGVSAVITVSAEGPLAYRDPLPWAALWLPVITSTPRPPWAMNSVNSAYSSVGENL